jgi:hypothetical protein
MRGLALEELPALRIPSCESALLLLVGPHLGGQLPGAPTTRCRNLLEVT